MAWSGWAIQNGNAKYAHRYMRFSPEATDGSAGATPRPLPLAIGDAGQRGDGRATPARCTRANAGHSGILGHLPASELGPADRGGGEAIREFLEDERRALRDASPDPAPVRMAARLRQHGTILSRAGIVRRRGGRKAFEENVGCTVPEFIEAGFFLHAGAGNSPTRIWKNHRPPEGMPTECVGRVLDQYRFWWTMPCLKPANCGRMAVTQLGYKPSVLRRHPILRFGDTGDDAMAPLPPLILQRITSGLYFNKLSMAAARCGRTWKALRDLLPSLPRRDARWIYRRAREPLRFERTWLRQPRHPHIRWQRRAARGRVPKPSACLSTPAFRVIRSAMLAKPMRRLPKAYFGSGAFSRMRGAACSTGGWPPSVSASLSPPIHGWSWDKSSIPRSWRSLTGWRTRRMPGSTIRTVAVSRSS